MTSSNKLVAIKLLHTAIWVFFNIVIFYLAWAVIAGPIDALFWTGWGLILLESFTLLAFRWYCPLTVWARRYSDSERHNFDIYLPEWLAKHNKTIYTSIMGMILILTLIRLFTGQR